MIGPRVLKKVHCCHLARALVCAVLVMVSGGFGIIASNAAELTPRDLILLDRLTFGINASSAAHLQAVGTERWLNEQLHPVGTGPLPEAARSQIEAMPDVHKFPFDIAAAFDQQGRTANQIPDPDLKKAAQQTFQQGMNDRARQAAARTILRAL